MVEIQGDNKVWNYYFIFWVVSENKFRFNILEYYGFMYILMSDLVFIIDRGRPEEDAVKWSYGSL